jgi:hypothetical protein
MAPAEDGVDCAATGQACWDGQCLPVVCDASFSCDGAQLYRCEENGTAVRLVSDCAPALCEAAAGACRHERCEPSLPVCDGNVATTCNDRGTGYTGARVDCGSTGEACVGGACEQRLCAPEAYFCHDGDVHRCDKWGGGSVVEDACADFEHCTPGVDRCRFDVCTSGSPMCSGDVATVCKAEGSGAMGAGTDWRQSGQICRLGTCQSTTCTPNERFCSGGHVRVCNASGSASAPFETCEASEFCFDSALAHCRADICDASGPACSDERLAICNADGSGYVAVGDDCAVTGQVCDLSAACRMAATDTLGTTDVAEVAERGSLHLAVVRVDRTRRLARIEALLEVDAGTTLEWLVYEQRAATGDYDRILLQGTSAGGNGSSAFHAAGPLSTVLSAGLRYAIGVRVMGTHSVFRGGSSLPRSVSFGRAVGQLELKVEGPAAPAAHVHVGSRHVCTTYGCGLASAPPHGLTAADRVRARSRGGRTRAGNRRLRRGRGTGRRSVSRRRCATRARTRSALRSGSGAAARESSR